MLRAIFGLFLTGLLFSTSIGLVAQRLEDPNFIAEHAQKTNLYGKITTQLEDLLPEDTIKVSGLSTNDVAEVITESISAEKFYDFLRQYLTEYLSWLTGEKETFRFSYGLESIRSSLVDGLTQKQVARYAALPQCSTEQLKSWDPQKLAPNCRLADSSVKNNDVKRIFRLTSEKSLEGLPTSIQQNSSPGMEQTKTVFAKAKQTMSLVYLLTAAVIALYLLIWRRKAFLPLAGIFLAVGLLQVGFSLIAWDWLGRLVAESISGSDYASIAPLVVSIVSSILEVLKTALGNISIVMLGAGSLLLVLGFVSWIHRPSKSSAERAAG